MYRNYFYLARVVEELNTFLPGAIIKDVYTQEKDKLFFHVPIKDKPNFHLIVSTNARNHSITIKDEHNKARKNTINFFYEFLPAKIKMFQIAIGERVILLQLENAKLYIQFRGAKSNIFLIDNSGVFISFKKIDNNTSHRIKQEFELLKFTSSSEVILNSVNDLLQKNEIKNIPFIGKEIMREVDFRGDELYAALLGALDELIRAKIVVYIDDFGEAKFQPFTFHRDKKNGTIELFDSYFEALHEYFILSTSSLQSKSLKKDLEKFINTEIDKLTSKLNNLKARIELGSREQYYQKCGSLLLANIDKIKKGMKEFTVKDFETDESYIIKINPKLNAQQNINNYFEKARSEKIEYAKSKEIFEIAEKKYSRLKEIEKRLTVIKDDDELLQIKKELRMKPKSEDQKEENRKISFRHYIVEKKYHIYVGRDSKNNDKLTTQFAKQNDYWFHARSVSGSHVVLRVESSKESIPKKILEKAASVAAFYSKAKTSKLVPVSYTLKKYVVKNKSHTAGQVTLLKENVLLVKPEIPNDCEFVNEHEEI